MATLAASGLGSFYDPGPIASWGVAANDEQSAMDSAQAGLQQDRLTRDFTQYNLPSYLSQRASRGSFYGGGTLQGANRLQESTNENIADTGTSLARILAGRSQNNIGLTTGGNF